MNVGGLNNVQSGVGSSNAVGGANTAAPPANAAAQQTPADYGPAAVYEPSPPPVNNFRPDMDRVSEMWNNHQAQVDSFRRMIETLLSRQAEQSGMASGIWPPEGMEITDAMRAEAQEQIEAGGYFSVEETAARILNFAAAIAGGDPSRIETLRRGVERGFAEAERIWGGELPEISNQTFAAVMNGFDEWQSAGSASAITLLNR